MHVAIFFLILEMLENVSFGVFFLFLICLLVFFVVCLPSLDMKKCAINVCPDVGIRCDSPFGCCDPLY